jgi:hypothetical protein
MADQFIVSVSSPYFPVALFLFGVGFGVAGGGIATAQTVESNQRVFDVASTIRNAPLFGTSLDLSWQELGGAISGLRVEGAVDFRTIFRLGLDVHFHHLDLSSSNVLAWIFHTL